VDLKPKDLAKLDSLLKGTINKYNQEQELIYIDEVNRHPLDSLDKRYFVIDLKLYKRQYVVTVNTNGEVEVWVNCFCSYWDRDWKKEVIYVCDGGNCYFNLKINLTTGKCYDLYVNGSA
jgi:hypothetical protein